MVFIIIFRFFLELVLYYIIFHQLEGAFLVKLFLTEFVEELQNMTGMI